MSYRPPPGPPPGYQERNDASTSYKPPPGPPPGFKEINDPEPPPYHNWQEVVPDTSTLPPPPTISLPFSETGNASEDDAGRAHAFCDTIPLWKPAVPPESVYNKTLQGDIHPARPAEFRGNLQVPVTGKWIVQSAKNCPDCVIISILPLYYAMRDSPLRTEKSKTIYFEVKITRLHQPPHGDASGLSIGFLAQPYPSWRSPGWERGSVGVFSDDGCRFVNNSFGGTPFTAPFKVGETVGLGMTISLPTGQQEPIVGPNVRIFFTRNGGDAGSWDLHEELDVDSGDVEGLEGDFDLYGAVGIFGGVEFEACFERNGWLWNPFSNIQ
ncbi:hypothetical protein BGW36DRAFT_387638 [Talaromyces proteolyticus]|uniref:SPRY domain-containing protein n=1 Tax=Talaromyces proteolyticus TaxID=1131652 RepID=A0AAD4KJJ9_9EURO|nr:uncharacterized protein BGW36DRAFT_387638 [Talaromyces proteolyticus]KAH8692439.1 hypothetical protein BGW36DRAFT_387638 [Talaromyces proteolyticus]